MMPFRHQLESLREHLQVALHGREMTVKVTINAFWLCLDQIIRLAVAFFVGVFADCVTTYRRAK